MAEREYLDVDIPLNLKEGGIVGNGPGHDAQIVTHGIDLLRNQANTIIRSTVEHYRAQGWTPERSIDLLQIYRDRRMQYKITGIMRKLVILSVRITFHRESQNHTDARPG
jgi:hypothetical protein